jgi:hypothetical protein
MLEQGIKSVGFPIGFLEAIQGEVIIDFKEGRYKVIVKRITKDVIDYDDFRAFEDTAMDGPRFSKIFKTHPCAEILQFTLDNFFVVKVKKDDW